jgi:hypothetical protein
MNLMHLPTALVVEAAIGVHMLIRRAQRADANAAGLRATYKYRPGHGRYL